MKNKLLIIVFHLLVLASCQDKSTPQSTQPTIDKNTSFETIGEINLFNRIESYAKILQAKADQETDFVTANKLVKESQKYADKYWRNEKTPAILFRAGEVARSIKQPEEAINIFRRLYTQFPTTPFAVKAMFMEAATFEDDLKNKAIAKKVYQKVIDKYPDDILAEQARQLLAVIEKTPEELIKEFQQKN